MNSKNLSYKEINTIEALDFCKKNSLTPFPYLSIEFSLLEKANILHLLSFYKDNPFCLVSLFPKKFSFAYLPHYGFVIHESVRNWHINKSTFKQIIIDENIKFILEYLDNNEEYKFSISTEPNQIDIRGINWALTYNENLTKSVKKETFYTGILNLEASLNLDDWMKKNFSNLQKRTYKKGIMISDQVIKINYIPDNLKDIFIEMFEAQGIYLSQSRLRRFNFIIENYVKKTCGIGNYMLFKKMSSDNNIIGYDFFINFKKVSYYIYGVNKPELRKYSKPGFHWSQYRENLIKLDIQKIDTCGVNSPNRGIFKTSLGSSVVPYWYFATE